MQKSEQNNSDKQASKSQRKRDMLAVQQLGEQLAALPDNRLSQIELPGELREAIDLARHITAHGGKRRQLQYIGKLMRNLDTRPILETLEQFKQQDRRETLRFQQLEQLRDRLITEDDTAISELLKKFPNTDHQHLRQLIRQAKKEQERKSSPRAARRLFKVLRELDTQN